jgi:triphosphatase
LKQPDLPREIELKLRLPRGSRALVEASRWFAGTPGREIHQVTTYFDTSDRALDRAGLTLRVRRIGTTRIQTVKSRPNDQGIATNRNEWEWRIAQAPDISRLAKTPSLAAVARSLNGKLERLFVTDIRRTVRLLHLDEDTVVEAAIDEGTIKSDGKRESVSELELELKTGSVEQIYRVAADLQALVPLWISPESKAARGWYLRAGRTPTVRATLAPRVERSTRAAQGFQDIIARTLGHLIANISPTLHGVAEGLHEMRIALRATRAALKLFERHLAPSAMARYDVQLQRFGRIFGTARDWDVFCLQTLPPAMSKLGSKEMRVLQAAADAQRKAALAVVGAVIRGQEFTALVLAIASWTEAGATQPSLLGDERMGKRLLTLAPSMLDRVNSIAKKRARHPRRMTAVELHRLRKSLKRLCCDVESLSGLYSRHAVKAYCGRCEQTLKLLGRINDATVTRQLTRSLLIDGRSELTTPAAALVRWSKRGDGAARQGLQGALRAFRAEPAFWSK